MKITNLRPMLWTNDLEGSIQFYTEKLGFTCDVWRKDWNWASLSLDEVSIMLTKPLGDDVNGEICFSGSFYFNTDDVETAWTKFKDKAKVCYDIESFEHGMREFGIYDNNGYLLQFGQEIESE